MINHNPFFCSHLDEIFNCWYNTSHRSATNSSQEISTIPSRVGVEKLPPQCVLRKRYSVQDGKWYKWWPQSFVQRMQSLLLHNRSTHSENVALLGTPCLHPSLDQIEGKSDNCPNNSCAQSTLKHSHGNRYNKPLDNHRACDKVVYQEKKHTHRFFSKTKLFPGLHRFVLWTLKKLVELPNDWGQVIDAY